MCVAGLLGQCFSTFLPFSSSGTIGQLYQHLATHVDAILGLSDYEIKKLSVLLTQSLCIPMCIGTSVENHCIRDNNL